MLWQWTRGMDSTLETIVFAVVRGTLYGLAAYACRIIHRGTKELLWSLYKKLNY